MFGTRKLGRTSSQRKAMLRAMTTYLFENGKMETTFTRAKEVQPVAEKMITLGKKNTLATYRKALSYITKEDVANKLFKEIAPKYADRNGGYTRVTRIGPRRGDVAEMAVIELSDSKKHQPLFGKLPKRGSTFHILCVFGQTNGKGGASFDEIHEKRV